MAKDYYEILGVNKGASDDEIKKSYRRLARKFHPDVNKEKGAEDQFKEVQKAYETLSDSGKRQRYDQFGEAAEQGFGGGPGGFGGGGGFGDFSGGFGEDMGGFSDIFDMFFNGQGGQRRPGRTRQEDQAGEDLRYDLKVPFEVAVKGSEYTIEVTQLVTCATCSGSGARPGTKPANCGKCNGAGRVRMVQRTILGSFEQVTTCPNCQGEGKVISSPCTDCNGSGRTRKTAKVKVKVPAGVETGTRLRISGGGHAGVRGGSSGDLYIFIEVEESDIFSRDGADIYSAVNISFAQAVLGGEITVDSANGKIKVEIPAATQPSTTLRLRGKGLPKINDTGRGDHFLKVNLEVPSNLSAAQKDALQKFSDSLGNANPEPKTEKKPKTKESRKAGFFWDE